MSKEEYKKNIFNLRSKGFTLIEALVAFSILSVALAAFVSSTVTSMESFRRAADSHFASKLAQEGIEMVISKKNNHITCVKRGECSSWRDNLSDGSYEVSSARASELRPSETFSSYAGDPWKPGKLCFLDSASGGGSSDDDGKFGYCTGPSWSRDGSGYPMKGEFKREVYIESLGGGADSGDPDGIRVKSIVRWNNTGSSFELILETLLYGN